MTCCKPSEPNGRAPAPETGRCFKMCIRMPAEQGSSRKYMEAVRCYDDEHRNWAYFRFWRSARRWPPLADTIGDFYVAAARDTRDDKLALTNQRYAKRFYERAARSAPTPKSGEKLAAQYGVLAALASTPDKAAAYRAKARTARQPKPPPTWQPRSR